MSLEAELRRAIPFGLLVNRARCKPFPAKIDVKKVGEILSTINTKAVSTTDSIKQGELLALVELAQEMLKLVEKYYTTLDFRFEEGSIPDV